jgi:hypothetical protein
LNGTVSPVPEPSFGLVMAGGAGVAWVVRRRRSPD